MDKGASSIKRSHPANITFVLGNGFDLGLGMKTSYRDIYDTYIQTPSASDNIKRFKDEIKIHVNSDLWSDFEMGLAKYATTLSSERDLLECLRDFQKHMIQHLTIEDDYFYKTTEISQNVLGIVDEFNRSIENFYLCFSPNVINQFKQVLGENVPVYNAITFNYTSSIEYLINARTRALFRPPFSPLHVHGSLKTDVVLGVDNEQQIADIKYPISYKGKRAFVKTTCNRSYDTTRAEKAQNILLNSDIICVYGFSMGESDKTWVDLIVQWLQDNPNHHLVVYQYDTTQYIHQIATEIMDAEDDKKEAFIKQLGLDASAVFDQIHIPIDYDIFNFKFDMLPEENKPFGLPATLGDAVLT